MLVRSGMWFIDGMSLRDIQWHIRCDMLLEHDRLFGTCNVPKRRVCRLPDNTIVMIATWLRDQRGRSDSLPVDRKRRLQSLVDEGKLDWYLDAAEVNRDDAKWDMMYSLLVKYGRENDGDCNVPRSYVATLEDGTSVKLGAWLKDQRKTISNFKLSNTRLFLDRKAKLQVLVDAGKLKWHMRD